MVSVIAWLRGSNRWKHLAGGFALGAASDGWWCAALTSLAAASCLEFKDRDWGGKWDWTDWTLTVAGGAAGFALRMIVI